MFGMLNKNWHNVPAGTRLEIIETLVAFGDTVHVCRRIDNENLPGAYRPVTSTRILASFVDIIK